MKAKGKVKMFAAAAQEPGEAPRDGREGRGGGAGARLFWGELRVTVYRGIDL